MSISMQYINVVQFYQSVLCFTVPLLIVQRIILICYDLSSKYEAYRKNFYDDEFKFLNMNQSIVEEPTIKETMLEENKIQGEQASPNPVEQQMPQNRQSQQLKRSSSQPNESIRNQNRVTKDDFDLERDVQLKNNPPEVKMNKTKSVTFNQPSKPKQFEHEEQSDDRQKQIQEEKEKQKQPPSPTRSNKYKNQDKPIVTQEDIQEHGNQQKYVPAQSVMMQSIRQQSQKIVIELGRGKLQEKGEKDQMRLRYCRRVDDTFSFHIPIIMSIVVLGILTESVYIFSMCCFFGYAYATLLFNFSILLDKMEGSSEYDSSIFAKINKLISSFFIIGLFVSYWISNEFS